MTGCGKLTFFLAIVLVAQVHSFKKDWQKPRCGWVRCEPNCRKVKGEDGCYKCDCEPLCSPPKCGPGCEIQKVFDGPCPGCECKEIDFPEPPLEAVCDPVKCEFPCKEVPPEGPGKCPDCLCEPEIKCDPCPIGCKLQLDSAGPCLECDCRKAEPPLEVCDPIKCEFPCKEVLPGGPGKCPECVCEPEVKCDPPKCPRGCTIQLEYDGPCPGCDCKKDVREPPVMFCDPPKCPRGCTIETEYDGPCPGCDCKRKSNFFPLVPRNVPCDPPKCPPGCSIQKVYDGPCPGCDCEDEEDEEMKKCSPIIIPCDGPKCELVKDEDGCDFCKCAPECTIPKCRRWCRIKEVEDGCPVCECGKRMFWRKFKKD